MDISRYAPYDAVMTLAWQARERYRFKRLSSHLKPEKLMPNDRVVVSLTTHPGRIGVVHHAIRSMLSQTRPPGRLLLVLAPNEWGSDEAKKKLERFKSKHKALIDMGLELVWGDDTRSHNKYRYAFNAFPSSIVVTIDDDRVYWGGFLEALLAKLDENPDVITAMIARRLYRDSSGAILRDLRDDDPVTPQLGLQPLGIFGVAYPPGIRIREAHSILMDKKLVHEHAIMDDDSWLGLNAMKAGDRIQSIGRSSFARKDAGYMIARVPRSQKVALWRENNVNGAYDVQVTKMARFLNVHGDIELRDGIARAT